MRKFAVLDPAGTTMREGTSATSGCSERRRILVSDVEDGFRSVILPVIVLPPSVELAESVNDERAVAGGSTARVTDLVIAPKVAEISTEVELVTFVVVTLKWPDNSPRGTIMLAGIEATAGSELDRFKDMPPSGAGPLRRNVPGIVSPPSTIVDERRSFESPLGVAQEG